MWEAQSGSVRPLNTWGGKGAEDTTIMAWHTHTHVHTGTGTEAQNTRQAGMAGRQGRYTCSTHSTQKAWHRHTYTHTHTYTAWHNGKGEPSQSLQRGCGVCGVCKMRAKCVKSGMRVRGGGEGGGVVGRKGNAGWWHTNHSLQSAWSLGRLQGRCRWYGMNHNADMTLIPRPHKW